MEPHSAFKGSLDLHRPQAGLQGFYTTLIARGATPWPKCPAWVSHSGPGKPPHLEDKSPGHLAGGASPASLAASCPEPGAKQLLTWPLLSSLQMSGYHLKIHVASHQSPLLVLVSTTSPSPHPSRWPPGPLVLTSKWRLGLIRLFLPFNTTYRGRIHIPHSSRIHRAQGCSLSCVQRHRLSPPHPLHNIPLSERDPGPFSYHFVLPTRPSNPSSISVPEELPVSPARPCPPESPPLLHL